MNLNKTQTRYAGIGLITLAIVMIFNLWSLIPVVFLAGGGIYIYRRERQLGRINTAVQGALWGVGLALLYVLDFILPGVLLLAGASLLLRGREDAADNRLHRTLARLPRRRFAAPATSATSAAPAQPPVTIVNEEQPRPTETVRLS